METEGDSDMDWSEPASLKAVCVDLSPKSPSRSALAADSPQSAREAPPYGRTSDVQSSDGHSSDGQHFEPAAPSGPFDKTYIRAEAQADTQIVVIRPGQPVGDDTLIRGHSVNIDSYATSIKKLVSGISVNCMNKVAISTCNPKTALDLTNVLACENVSIIMVFIVKASLFSLSSQNVLSCVQLMNNSTVYNGIHTGIRRKQHKVHRASNKLRVAW